jgi:TetR/AcrR family transcriptional regulator, ethionamide resistance regulator
VARVRERDQAPPRRRRTPEAAQREIIEAAESLLKERPFRELTVDEVMRRTGLSRPSFYVYFKDRHELVLRLVAHLESELRDVSGRWYDAIGAGPRALRDSVDGVVEVYGRHSTVLRALADAAAEDSDVEEAYGALIQNFVDVTRTHIETEMELGLIPGLDATEVSKALLWMTERYLYHAFAPAHRVPAQRVADTLLAVWSRTLYQAS